MTALNARATKSHSLAQVLLSEMNECGHTLSKKECDLLVAICAMMVELTDGRILYEKGTVN